MIYFNDKIFYHNLANFSETDFKNDKFKHNFYELIIFLKGEAELSLNSFSYKLTKQTVALVSPESNRFIKSTSEKPASLIHIYFNPALLPDYFNNIDDICDKCYSSKYNSAFNLLVLALQATEKKGYDNEAFLNYLLFAMPSMLFQIELMSDKKQFSSTPSNKLLAACVNYINNNITEEFSLDKLSADFFVSKSHLSHIFKQNLGIGIRQYINKQKMLYAQKLIRAGNNPVKVSHICSFDNYSTFFRLYKNTFGITPEQDKNPNG